MHAPAQWCTGRVKRLKEPPSSVSNRQFGIRLQKRFQSFLRRLPNRADTNCHPIHIVLQPSEAVHGFRDNTLVYRTGRAGQNSGGFHSD